MSNLHIYVAVIIRPHPNLSADLANRSWKRYLGTQRWYSVNIENQIYAANYFESTEQ